MVHQQQGIGIASSPDQAKKPDPDAPLKKALGKIKQKFLITFIISTLIWAIIAILIHMEIIDFYEISRQMMAEDAAR